MVIAFDPPDADRGFASSLSAGEVVLLVPPAAESYVQPDRRDPAGRSGCPARSTRPRSAAAARRAAIAGCSRRGSSTGRCSRWRRCSSGTTPRPSRPRCSSSGLASGPPAPPPVRGGAGGQRCGTGQGLRRRRQEGRRHGQRPGGGAHQGGAARAEKIGRVELRDGFMLVEVPAQDAERVAAALNGTTIRRRRVTARVDRGARLGPGRRPRATPRP